ncbi:MULTISPECIES: TnpV protein [Paenibacillaceae]|uniref:TnpV protein n=1 Tax=Paenibacillaceae TaxID=186822 RepID=UPI000685AEB9|nr:MULTISPECIES: TnpV protein [Paenibacillaceae]GIP30867.1 TnpV protein [Paenibacillus sp. J2TS4]
MTEIKANLNYSEQTDGLLYPQLQISNQAEADQQPLGKYGRMALNYLRNHHPQRFMSLKMQGNLMKKMHQADQEANEKMNQLTEQLLRLRPIPQTEDILERTRHLNQIKSTAEELVLNDIVLKPR